MLIPEEVSLIDDVKGKWGNAGTKEEQSKHNIQWENTSFVLKGYREQSDTGLWVLQEVRHTTRRRLDDAADPHDFNQSTLRFWRPLPQFKVEAPLLKPLHEYVYPWLKTSPILLSGEMLLWERSLVFFLAASNTSFLLLIFAFFCVFQLNTYQKGNLVSVELKLVT